MNSLLNRAAACCGIAIIATGGTALAEEDSSGLSWSSGIEYSSGTYGGTADIEDVYVPLTAHLRSDRVAFELTVPYLSVTAPAGTTVTDPGSEPLPGTGPSTTESGMGDIVAGVTVLDVLYSERLDVSLDLTGKIKFGTADETKGLGTGEQDFTVRADVYKFLPQFTLLGSVGYKFRGDPADLDLDDVLLASAGGAISLSDAARVGLMYDYRESALPDSDDISELSLFWSKRWNESLHMQLYLFTGFSDSSPDWGLGMLFELT